ncbi:MAG: bifunctional 4-hydroxy-2-oxoglutarate aldolase/2-dehydro-3-deoxy-phosphogluconate aldolase [Fibrobacter sp.]|uniref:bifunctional 4-hydroxy-2-oxoglutarate aldolase/2-dehydro-3-deoxy-phosphogluconate aldolase n=1 Tax=Fibrobacter sp. TaxID=35828 RepID=UPI001B2AE195|nr:bifunctional 4-hydroxy-2-oxoglutarate aldolase/2-dehydro-3-deoxy-phosphogluconate aldolase [Fibrobacter sp.]MBO7061127.1 bifunctional 4-hydroxy-2-oxoglutarate aldolase/2-dehydro-3-deoxy-phosphogluconate aldolase [Fibrobacter sp.]
MDLLEFLKPMPVVGILRDIPQGAEEACVKTAAQCGLKAIEVTMNTANAAEIIAALKTAAKPLNIAVGAGTVRHGHDLEKALAAGAEFIVTPNTRNEIIRLSCTAGVPIIPGALTPTEVQKAFDLGASAVKIFPVNCVGGPEYIKALRGPFRDIPLMACGGVNPENAQAYFKAGANLVSFGASIFDPKLMAAGDWKTIAEKLNKLLDAIK